jgi:steroid 5-alpha reductase family enzyme
VVNLFGIHVMPTVVVFLVMIPVFTVLTSNAPTTILTVFGWSIMVGAAMIQAFADKQMHDHLKEGSSAVNKTGLWSLSRHPNYFGEIAFWFGAYIMALSVSTNYLIGIGAFINLLMFMTISIPLMEKRQLKRRPEYESYIETTHVLIPIPKHVEDHKQNA